MLLNTEKQSSDCFFAFCEMPAEYVRKRLRKNDLLPGGRRSYPFPFSFFSRQHLCKYICGKTSQGSQYFQPSLAVKAKGGGRAKRLPGDNQFL